MNFKAMNAYLDAIQQQIEHPEVDDDSARWDWFGSTCPCNLPPGECTEHHRARPNQRWPEDAKRIVLSLGGRGSGKTLTGAQMVVHWAKQKPGGTIGLIGATEADYRDTMILGESGILNVSPPDFTPKWVPSQRAVVWPNGTRALCFASTEPDRIRGSNLAKVWGDEICAWKHQKRTLDMTLLALRVGASPQCVLTTTPKTTDLIRALVDDPNVRVLRSTSFDNRKHLAPEFFDEILTRYAGTPLEAAEINGELIDYSEAQWFTHFNPHRHVSELAEYDPGRQSAIAVDCGTSLTTAAVFYQVFKISDKRSQIRVFGEFLIEGPHVEEAVLGISREFDSLTQNYQGRPQLRSTYSNYAGIGSRYVTPSKLDEIVLDPFGANTETGVGHAATNEYRRHWGDKVSHWPRKGVLDGLTLISILLGPASREPDILIHPRCQHLIRAFYGYERQERGGRFLDKPKDPNHPHEDLMDALRGACTNQWPEGLKPDWRDNAMFIDARRLF